MKENEKDTKKTQEEPVSIEQEKLTDNHTEELKENGSEKLKKNSSVKQKKDCTEEKTENQKEKKAENSTKETKENHTEEQVEDPAPPSLDELTEKACAALKGNEGINESEIGSITQFLHSMISDINAGEMSKETIDTLLLAFRHDTDVENALREGEVKGRNAKIDEWKEQRRGMAGVHQLGNAASGGMTHVPQARLGGLCAADRQTIWERGKEKRVRY
ncbi:MAG: hypothetical protein IKR05_14630 [Prevotella sp.]|nr:hypothetical protein [Prevotella sp.]